MRANEPTKQDIALVLFVCVYVFCLSVQKVKIYWS